jgi:hypothetical protein
MTKQRLCALAAASAMLLALGACGGGGGGGDNGGGNAGAGADTPSGQLAADSFFDKVLALIGTTSETEAPVAVDSYEPTTPENAQPKPLG